jgi:hypothetical protein
VNPSDLTPLTLLVEMRERLTRIETKMDASAEKTEKLQEVSEDHEARIAALENGNTQLRTSLSTLKWVGGAVVTVATIFGDKIVAIVS